MFVWYSMYKYSCCLPGKKWNQWQHHSTSLMVDVSLVGPYLLQFYTHHCHVCYLCYLWWLAHGSYPTSPLLMIASLLQWQLRLRHRGRWCHHWDWLSPNCNKANKHYITIVTCHPLYYATVSPWPHIMVTTLRPQISWSLSPNLIIPWLLSSGLISHS